MRKLIIDTDPGIDDAMAILFALHAPELEVVGLTTIFGNVYTETATANALRLVELAGKAHVPVAQGAARPLYVALEGVADFVHGANGLGDIMYDLPAGQADGRTAAQFIVETVMASPGEVTLVPIGPLTNVALALALEPRIVQQVAEVIVMGGAATVNGNVNPAAEANFWNDPHAADRVFTAGWPITMVGLDVTERVVMDEAYFQSLRTSHMGAYIYEISRFYLDFYARFHGMRACHTHDPSAIAYAIDPTLFTARVGAVRVVAEGLARGQSIWDQRQEWHLPTAWSNQPLTNVCVDVDAPRMLELFRRSIAKAGEG